MAELFQVWLMSWVLVNSDGSLRWIDTETIGPFCWILHMIIQGLCGGCWNAWRWWNPSTFDSLGLVMQKFMESIFLDCLPRDLWPNLWEKAVVSFLKYFTIFHHISPNSFSMIHLCSKIKSSSSHRKVEMQTPSDAVRYEVTYTDIKNDTINQQWCSTTGFNKKSFGGSLEVPTQENST